MKLNKGITLISLVITIVIMLILAGVSIVFMIGDNGIIGKAKKAKEDTLAAQERENKEMDNTVDEMNNIYNGSSEGGNNQGGTSIKNNDEFFLSDNGFTNGFGTCEFNRFYGIKPVTFERDPSKPVASEEDIYSSVVKNVSYRIPDNFEISLKSRVEASNANELGGIEVILQKKNDDNSYTNVLSVSIRDGWVVYADIVTRANYNGNEIYNNRATGSYQQSHTYGFIGDGTNVKFYCDEKCLATVAQVKDLSIDRVVVKFSKTVGYNPMKVTCLERLHIGDLMYYKDI